jgi:hypothetical protein
LADILNMLALGAICGGALPPLRTAQRLSTTPGRANCRLRAAAAP